MKFIKALLNRNKKNSHRATDFYQDSVERAGHDEIKKLANKGLSIPVFIL